MRFQYLLVLLFVFSSARAMQQDKAQTRARLVCEAIVENRFDVAQKLLMDTLDSPLNEDKRLTSLFMPFYISPVFALNFQRYIPAQKTAELVAYATVGLGLLSAVMTVVSDGLVGKVCAIGAGGLALVGAVFVGADGILLTEKMSLQIYARGILEGLNQESD